MVDGKRWRRWGLGVGGIVLLLSGGAAATSLEEGISAYREGRYETALPVLREQAQKNDAEALFWLGQAFLKGHGVPFDYALAHEYFLRAARLGNRKAQNNIGMLHRDGLGVREDKITAYAWFSIAAASADSPLLAAVANRDRLEIDLQPDQLKRAAQRIVELSRTIRTPSAPVARSSPAAAPAPVALPSQAVVVSPPSASGSSSAAAGRGPCGALCATWTVRQGKQCGDRLSYRHPSPDRVAR